MIRHVSLIMKRGAETPLKVGGLLEGILKKRGIGVTLDRVDDKSQAVVVLGGDGTLLHIAAGAYRLGLPLLGINLGGLGFLTEIHLDEVEKAMDQLLEGRFTLDKRMMLEIKTRGPGSSRKEPMYALNEVTVSKGPLSRMINLPTWVDGSFVTTYRGDGLIVSTPTGSTAYNLSAGGPILHPAMEATIITPICPFALSSRPLILDGASAVEIRLDSSAGDVSLVVDGQTSSTLNQGDTIRITRAPGHLLLVKSPVRDYFTILREKLGWTAGVGV